VKKAVNSIHFLAAGLSVIEHIISHFVETRTNTKWRVMWCFLMAKGCVVLSCIHELSIALTLVA
jgi:hypothetical protein